MKRVLLIGDGIALTTGFAQVIKQVAAELVQRGHHVEQLAALEIGPQYDAEPYRSLGVEPYFCNSYDHIGRQVLPVIYERINPDVVFINTDAGTANIWRRVFAVNPEMQAPVVLYAPIEGAPICPPYARPFEWADVAYTYTRWSQERLKAEWKLDVPYVYHGVDTNVFKPLDEGLRIAVRKSLGWHDKLVISYVARNAGRKAQDRLIKAIAELKARGIDDVLLYLHCKSWDNNQLQGWDLRGVAHFCGVTDQVQFADQHDAAKGERQIGLAQKYAASDLYVHPAKVEGFGLPLLEAAACGLPIVVPADGGNIQEVAGPAALLLLEPHDIETWFNGAQIVNLHPGQLAEAIRFAKDNPTARKKAGQAARQWAKRFSWEKMRITLADAIERVEPRTAAYAAVSGTEPELMQVTS